MKRFLFIWLCCENGTEFVEHRLHSSIYDDPDQEIIDTFIESCYPDDPETLPFGDIELDGVIYNLQRVIHITEEDYNVMRKYLTEGF